MMNSYGPSEYCNVEDKQATVDDELKFSWSKWGLAMFDSRQASDTRKTNKKKILLNKTVIYKLGTLFTLGRASLTGAGTLQRENMDGIFLVSEVTQT